MVFEKINKEEVTEEVFAQVMLVENSTGNGYSEETMRLMWQTSNKNDNFVCKDDKQIVAIITFNPNSKRRNGSVYMVNLTVLPKYRKMGIAQNLILKAVEYYLSKEIKTPMSLSVDRDNIPATKLYQKVGYEIKTPLTQMEIEDDDEQFIMEASAEKIRCAILNNLKQSELEK